ncbi:MFS transporter [Halegenticoccus soli]|uniref:MFS transporter n=1 Tax=Halegenticoccus soli TaxID=1985678 RepID=UPI000C6DEF04|nr:MFS transporter [Halegenticoccus soli]
MDRRRAWIIAIFLFVFGDAVALQSRGALLASFEAEFGVSEGLLGLVAPAGTVGFVLAVLAAGLLAGRLDARRTMLVGTAGALAGLLLLAGASDYRVLLLALLVQGTAGGVFRGIDRAVLSHLYPTRRGRLFSLYSLAWAIGAVAGPLVVTGALRVADWRATYLLVAAWFVPVAALVARLDVPDDLGGERTLSLAALRRLLRRPAVLGAGAAMALTGGIEGAVFTWLPYYASTFFDRTLANAALSVYLLGYVPGRLLYTWLVERVSYLSLVGVVSLLAVPVLAAAFAATTGYPMLAATFAAGVLVSGLFPTLSAYSVDAEPAYSGPINALTTGATYLGLAVVPTAMGVVAEARGIGAAMATPAFLAAALVAVVALTVLATGTRGVPDVAAAE